MRRTAKKTGLLVTSAVAGLATLSQCSAGLFDGLFDRQSSRDAIEKRLPACDCSFGYFSTSWQPWGTCDEGRNAGCASDGCRTAPPSVLPGFQPGYSSSPSLDLQPYEEVWSSPGSVIPPQQTSPIPVDPRFDDNSPTPILMAPQQARPDANSNGIPADQFEPELVSPFPRAIKSNPELLAPNPYPVPQPNGGLLIGPAPRAGSTIELPFSPSRSPLDLPASPTSTPKPAVSGPTSDTGSSGTGITLPPRRSTSVTIDIPSGSAGSTLTLPDPVRSGTIDDPTTSPGRSSPSLSSPGQPATGLPAKPGATLPDFDDAFPAVTPGSPPTAPEPEPSLRPQPPMPRPSTLPPSSAAYRYPIQQPVTQYPAVQHPAVQPASSQYPATPGYPAAQPQQFQPATHWQAVPQRQQQPNANWRVMPGFYPQPVIQQPVVQPPQARVQMQAAVLPPQIRIQPPPQVRIQRPGPTPSERVIMLPPPPRR